MVITQRAFVDPCQHLEGDEEHHVKRPGENWQWPGTVVARNGSGRVGAAGM